MLKPGDEIAGCQVESLIAEGGQSVVYAVRRDDHPYALKLLRVRQHKGQERLLREATVLQRIDHPNLARVHEVIPYQGRTALLMDRAETTLQALLEQGPLPSNVLDPIAAGVLAGLAAAHLHGVVHRDLKPSNILLDRQGKGWFARITDFGMVRIQGETNRLTTAGAVVGTPMYMAPEQLSDPDDVDQRADVFAMGIVLYEMATGRRPVEPRSLVEMYERATAGIDAEIEVDAAHLPKRMRVCIQRCLALRPEDRYTDAKALRAAWIGFQEPWADPEATEIFWDDKGSTMMWGGETTRVLKRLTGSVGRSELVHTVEERLTRARVQRSWARAIAVFLVFGTLLGGVLAGLFILIGIAWWVAG